MAFLPPAGDAPAFEFEGAEEAVAMAACFRPAAFFWAAAARSEGSAAGSVCVTGESGVGEVSSGKVVLHVMLLETKKFSLAGR